MPEWGAWRNAIARCTDETNKNWERYGGRGIEVCDDWVHDATGFEAFLDHIGPRPGPGWSLDRIDNDGNYEPGNVRWATAKTQANNKTRDAER